MTDMRSGNGMEMSALDDHVHSGTYLWIIEKYSTLDANSTVESETFDACGWKWRLKWTFETTATARNKRGGNASKRVGFVDRRPRAAAAPPPPQVSLLSMESQPPSQSQSQPVWESETSASTEPTETAVVPWQQQQQQQQQQPADQYVNANDSAGWGWPAAASAWQWQPLSPSSSHVAAQADGTVFPGFPGYGWGFGAPVGVHAHGALDAATGYPADQVVPCLQDSTAMNSVGDAVQQQQMPHLQQFSGLGMDWMQQQQQHQPQLSFVPAAAAAAAAASGGGGADAGIDAQQHGSVKAGKERKAGQIITTDCFLASPNVTGLPLSSLQNLVEPVLTAIAYDFFNAATVSDISNSLCSPAECNPSFTGTSQCDCANSFWVRVGAPKQGCCSVFPAMDPDRGLVAGTASRTANRRSITANAPLVVTINNAAANPDMAPNIAVNVDYGLFVLDSFTNPQGPVFVIIWPNYGQYVSVDNNFIRAQDLIFTAAGLPLAQPVGVSDPTIVISPGVTMEFAGIPRLLVDQFEPFRFVDVVAFNVSFNPAALGSTSRSTYTFCLGNVLHDIHRVTGQGFARVPAKAVQPPGVAALGPVRCGLDPQAAVARAARRGVIFAS